MNVIPITTGIMKPIIYLILRLSKHLRLNEQLSEFVNFSDTIKQTLLNSNSSLDKGITQISNGLQNIKTGKETINVDNIFNNN